MSTRRKVPAALAAERRTPIPTTPAPALATLDELIGVLARALSTDYRERHRR